MARKKKPGRAAHSPRGKKGGSSKGALKLLNELRTQLAKSTGKAKVGRGAIAKFLGVSIGTVFNWDSGKVAIPEKRVRELEAAIAKAKGGGKSAPVAKGRSARPVAKSALRGKRGSDYVASRAHHLAAMAQAFTVCGTRDAAQEAFDAVVLALG